MTDTAESFSGVASALVCWLSLVTMTTFGAYHRRNGVIVSSLLAGAAFVTTVVFYLLTHR